MIWKMIKQNHFKDNFEQYQQIDQFFFTNYLPTVSILNFEKVFIFWTII